MTAAEWASPLVAALADAAVKSAALLVVASLLVLCLRRASAAVRHSVWLAAVAGALAMPLLSPMLPALRVGFTTPAASVATASATDTTAVTIGGDDMPKGALGVPPDALVPRGAASLPWRSLALGLWLCGVAVVLARTASSSLRVRAIVRAGHRPTGDGWDAVAARASERLGLRRPARLVVSTSVAAPATWGVRAPVVLLPESAESWPESRREAVLLHELAHARRRDCATQLVASAACALYWFDPLVWIAAGAMRDEREHAADDRVLDSGVRASDYATLLLDAARTTPRPFAPAAAAFASERRSHLERRIRSVLDPGRPRHAAGRTAALAAVVVATFALAPIAGAGAPKQLAAPPPPPPPSAPDVALPNPPAPPDVEPPPPPRPSMSQAAGTIPAPPQVDGPPTPPPAAADGAPLPPAPPEGEPPPAPTGTGGQMPHPSPRPNPRPHPMPQVEIATPDDVPPAAATAEERRVIDALQEALHDDDAGVREQAQWALRMIKLRNGEVRVRTHDTP